MNYKTLALGILTLIIFSACKEDNVEQTALRFAERESKAMLTFDNNALTEVCDEMETWKRALSSADQAKADSIEAAFLQQFFKSNLLGE